jgi:hypothetical protein
LKTLSHAFLSFHPLNNVSTQWHLLPVAEAHNNKIYRLDYKQLKLKHFFNTYNIITQPTKLTAKDQNRTLAAIEITNK